MPLVPPASSWNERPVIWPHPAGTCVNRLPQKFFLKTSHLNSGLRHGKHCQALKWTRGPPRANQSQLKEILYMAMVREDLRWSWSTSLNGEIKRIMKVKYILITAFKGGGDDKQSSLSGFLKIISSVTRVLETFDWSEIYSDQSRWLRGGANYAKRDVKWKRKQTQWTPFLLQESESKKGRPALFNDDETSTAISSFTEAQFGIPHSIDQVDQSLWREEKKKRNLHTRCAIYLISQLSERFKEHSRV